MKENAQNTVINVEGLWKHYGLLMPEFYYKGKHWMHHLFSGTKKDGGENFVFEHLSENNSWALQDVNFELGKGEALGILGRNGSGKSTLLKVLAGVSPPTMGKVEVKGRLFPMIELNAGMHMELSGRENVRLLGAIMGFSKEEIEDKIPDIEAFTELGDWFDRPVRMYSSGMLARLGFGVAMNADADILLADEVLAVGDLAFQRKCYAKMEKLYSDGQSLLLVSHALSQIARVCNSVIVFEQGKMLYSGSTEDGVKFYEELSRKHQEKTAQELPKGESIFGDIRYDFGEISLLHSELRSGGKKVEKIQSGDPVEIVLKVQVHCDLTLIRLAVVIESIRAEPVVWHYLEFPELKAGTYEIVQKIDALWLASRQYFVRIGFSVGKFKRKALGVQQVISITVQSDKNDLGYYHPPCKWSCERLG